MNAVEQYEFDQRTLANLHNQVMEARRKKNKAAGPSATRFRIMEDRLQRQYNDLKARIVKPSFWIDQDTIGGMQNKLVEKYDRYKAKNIRIQTRDTADRSQRALVEADRLSLGYTDPLFADISFTLHAGERLELKGRNGVGKSTLVKAILATEANTPLGSKIFAGQVILDPKIRIGVYEQEIDPKYLGLPLGEAITDVYADANLAVNDQKVRQVLSDYLFDPQADGRLPISHLSGGQKARFQLIKMLSTSPNLLILDEPTNHLDLPSIEELEKALGRFSGAILYISHDSYFTRGIGGEIIEISPAAAPTPPVLPPAARK